MTRYGIIQVEKMEPFVCSRFKTEGSSKSFHVAGGLSGKGEDGGLWQVGKVVRVTLDR